MTARLHLGIDVGTGSARAGLFDAQGRRVGVGSHPIAVHRPEDDFVEQSSDDIWSACGQLLGGPRRGGREGNTSPELASMRRAPSCCSMLKTARSP